ncbi:unnamed protein product [Rhizoctonia solani]|uniref:F-box domain-containing protein n=1 Tax=Rhizoctonia solani TaxID=456999 RepID=A0A8H3HDB0_9AGAM|nr:unnamed protein product [Rhizoctonia solani]
MNMRVMNDLPPEVLSRIFVLGEGMQRGSRAIRLPYVGFQDLVVQVCRRWREVAISTPELWTYIFISSPPPHLCAERYISRSGTLPLHIDLEMRTSFIKPIHPFHESEQAERALEALEFIEKSGGKRDRWRSLIIFSKALFAITSIYSFFTRRPTPALQFVSIKWKAHDDIETDQEELGVQEFGLSETTLAHGPERPQLRHVELNGLAKNFMCNDHSVLVSNLTRFTFIAPGTTLLSLPSYQQFSAVLAASPQLEHLSVDMQAAHYGFMNIESSPADIGSFQVRLPLLRSFSLYTGHLHRWGLNLLQIVDAPGVQCLDINTEHNLFAPDAIGLHQYLAKGRVNGVLQRHVPLDNNDTSGSGPIFPQLKHLSVQQMTRNVSPIFVAFPMVTHITFGGLGALTLCHHPEYLPNASHFTYIDGAIAGFSAVLELATRRVEHRAISTLVWCTGFPEDLRVRLGIEGDGIPSLGSEQHYRSPPGLQVDHLIIRKITHAPPYRGDSDDEVLAALDDEDNDPGFDIDEFVVALTLGQGFLPSYNTHVVKEWYR